MPDMLVQPPPSTTERIATLNDRARLGLELRQPRHGERGLLARRAAVGARGLGGLAADLQRILDLGP